MDQGEKSKHPAQPRTFGLKADKIKGKHQHKIKKQSPSPNKQTGDVIQGDDEPLNILHNISVEVKEDLFIINETPHFCVIEHKANICKDKACKEAAEPVYLFAPVIDKEDKEGNEQQDKGQNNQRGSPDSFCNSFYPCPPKISPHRRVR